MSSYTAAANVQAEPQKSISSIRKLVFISILGAISFVLMLLDFSTPIAPSFLKFDIADLPALFAGFFLGPLSGFGVVCIKLLLDGSKLILHSRKQDNKGLFAEGIQLFFRQPVHKQTPFL